MNISEAEQAVNLAKLALKLAEDELEERKQWLAKKEKELKEAKQEEI